MKRTESAGKNSKSKGSLIRNVKGRSLLISSRNLRFVVCVKNDGHIDLEPLKVYKVKSDAAAKAMGLLRVVDASGEDYLYPIGFFRPIQATSRLFQIVKELA